MESLSTYLKASKSELPFTTASTFSLLTWRFLLPVLKRGQNVSRTTETNGVGFSLLLVSQDKQCFFFSATQRTDHEVAHFSWTSFAALFIMAKLVEKLFSS